MPQGERMCVLDEANEAMNDFIEEHISCATCGYWTPELIGGICNGPEAPMGYREDDTSMCEQHEFKDRELQEQLDRLFDKWNNAWHIVEGFLYEDPPIGEL
jgi:hypothetical protein